MGFNSGFKGLKFSFLGDITKLLYASLTIIYFFCSRTFNPKE